MPRNVDSLVEPGFYEKIRLGNKIIEGRFVIPSGIRCTNTSTIERIFGEVPSVGIVTTKSISINPKEGYREPIFIKYWHGSYMNAVGLENPGAEHFRDLLSNIRVPGNKFLLVSLFGSGVDEFVRAAQVLESVADGFELNMSCPHTKGYGIEVGDSKELVAEITGAVVVDNTSLPVFVKLSANIRDIAITAKAAIEAGARGITAINTVGPGLHYVGNAPVLFNELGGLSGDAIRPVGISSVRKIRDAVGPEPLIIGLGGISESQHVRDYYLAGADFFAVGSAMTGMNSAEAKQFFQMMNKDLLTDTMSGNPFKQRAVDTNLMDYYPCRVIEKESFSEELFKIQVDELKGTLNWEDCAGRFYFICIPGTGEKPFALFSKKEKSFVIRAVGPFTRRLAELSVGDTVYVRGPYGRGIPDFADRKVVLVGGGRGVAPLLEIGNAYKPQNDVVFFLGAGTKQDLFHLDRFRRIGEVNLATDDGSLGLRGTVVDLLVQELDAHADGNTLAFISCGPEEMVRKCFEVQRRHASDESIWGSIEYHTSCGVGICGKCSTPDGLLSCVDGPFLSMGRFK